MIGFFQANRHTHRLGETFGPRLLASLAGLLILAASAAGASDVPDHLSRLRGVELDQDVETTHARLTSRHFVLLYPQEIELEHAHLVTEVLEFELQRLRVWIPHRPRQRFEILLFESEDFERAYGVTVSGIYDGRIRVPIVTSGRRTGVVTAALTHELVHALVTEYTDYGAPPWLQEGLAQYLEPDHRMPDPLRFGRAEGVPLPLVNEILTGATEPGLVGNAYRESAWAAHFLGHRFGISGIRRLLAAYAAGKDPETALDDALGLTTVELERQLETWRRGDAQATYRAFRARSEDAVRLHASRGGWMRLMREWHRGYEEQVGPVKQSLRQIVGAMRGGDAALLSESCPRLLDDLTVLFRSSGFFACPHWEARGGLVEAFRHFEELAITCELGLVEQMQAKLEAAERSLSVAAALLEPYGVRP